MSPYSFLLSYRLLMASHLPDLTLNWVIPFVFQTQTGFTDHLAAAAYAAFQTQTGSTGHLDLRILCSSRCATQGFNPERAPQAI